jgi:predicted ArsR family transcriptional regulator
MNGIKNKHGNEDLDKSDIDVLISPEMLTRSAVYAVRALSLLALREGSGAFHAAEIAAELGLPPQFLTKILRRLTATDLVSSQRGRPCSTSSLRSRKV